MFATFYNLLHQNADITFGAGNVIIVSFFFRFFTGVHAVTVVQIFLGDKQLLARSYLHGQHLIGRLSIHAGLRLGNKSRSFLLGLNLLRFREVVVITAFGIGILDAGMSRGALASIDHQVLGIRWLLMIFASFGLIPFG